MARTVIKILGKEWYPKPDNGRHVRTYVTLDNGLDACGYGEYEVGDQVMCFYHEKWDMVKIAKKENKV